MNIKQYSKITNPFPNLSSFCIFFWALLLMMEIGLGQSPTNSNIEVKVGVVLDLQTTFAKICLTSINTSLSDFYSSHPNYTTRLALHIRDSMEDVVGASAAALDLIKNEQVNAILGPGTSMQADFMISLGQKSHVPIITFSATSPSLASIRSPYFIRVSQDDSSQVKAISAIVKAFGWRNVVAVYVDNEFGESIVPYLADALQQVNARIAYRSVISAEASDDQILKELYKLMTMQTRVFVVHMLPSLGYRVFEKAKEIGMMEAGYVWILTDGMTNSMRPSDHNSLNAMQGVLGVRPHVPRSKGLEDFTSKWKMKFQEENPGIVEAELNIFGLWAYDATAALARAVEEAGTMGIGFDKVNLSSNRTDLDAFGVSRYGLTLLRALPNIRFKGLTGDFHLVNGQLQSSTYEIINLRGESEILIGFWTPSSGLAKKLNPSNKKPTPKEELSPIIWPGDSNSVPKGWEIPTNGKKLRVGVPVKHGFREFVNVKKDSNTNAFTVSGYSIEVFETVLEQVPYAITPEYIPFATPNGNEAAGSYNDLVYQVYLGNFDAVVGDITIVANRSKYVEFTLPYTQSGVSMVVPLKDDADKNTWVFLKPWTWDLWVTTACFFIFIGFVVWVLEHRINEDFRGPPTHQIGTGFWFAFCTMVFAQRERVVNNLARFVVIIWCFVVLILTQSYTASFTSLLTVQQLHPAVTNVNDLIKNGEYVGYQKGSFVLGILKGLGFNESRLRVYESLEELNELFSKGSSKRGIAAAFDEVPYIRVLLSRHCSNYTMVEPTFKTDGFGFVFPRGSLLAPEISRAILNVTEGDKMTRIENAWFKNQSNCQSIASLSSNRLSLRSFWGLFLIVGITSLLALLVFIAMFLYEHGHVWKQYPDSNGSIWRKSLVLLRIFDEKDLRSHTFRKNETGSSNRVVHSVISVDNSPSSHCPPSPSTSHNTNWPASPSSPSYHQKASNFTFYNEQSHDPTQ